MKSASMPDKYFRGKAVLEKQNGALTVNIKLVNLDDRNLRENDNVAIMKGYFTGALDDGCHSRKVLFERYHQNISESSLNDPIDMLDKNDRL